jgi:Zn-dependent protease
VARGDAVIVAASVTSASLQNVVYLAFGLLLGLVVHEYVHAFVALRLGDMSPKLAGRLTWKLRPHVEAFGTLLLPGILLLKVLFGQPPFVFGYAKPQPINQWGFRRQDRQVILISLAGPAANLALAVVFGLLFRLGLSATASETVLRFLGDLVIVNVILAVMNLMPIPPLDGARVVATLLPQRPREVMTNLEQYGALFMLVIFFIISGPIFTFVKVIGNGICQLVAGGDCVFV